MMIGLHLQLSFSYDENIDLPLQIRNKCRDMGQNVFSPVDVAGWQGNHEWINSETLPKRWEFADYLLIRYWKKNKNQFKKLIKGRADAENAAIFDRLRAGHKGRHEFYEFAIPKHFTDEDKNLLKAAGFNPH